MNLQTRDVAALRAEVSCCTGVIPAKVAAAAGVYDVIPAGEFQPASVALWDRRNDFDLWRNIVREYSEELLDTPEHDNTRRSRSTTTPGRCIASWRTPRQPVLWSRSCSVSA